MLRHSTGCIGAALGYEQLETFGLHDTSSNSTSSASGCCMSTNFLPDMVAGGVSAKDRAATLRALCDSSNASSAFSRQGHIFPQLALEGGVLERFGHAEAAYDLCLLSGQSLPVAAIAEMMRDDGTMYDLEEATRLAAEHGLPVVTVEELVAHRRSTEVSADNGDGIGGGGLDAGEAALQSESKIWIDDIEAVCNIRVYSTSKPEVEFIAIVKGEVRGAELVPVRLHSECFTGDILGSKRCDCGQQLHRFLRIVNEHEHGVLLYAKGHEGRGIGLANKIKAYQLQEEGHDTVDANLKLGLPVDGRTYEDAMAVMRDLGLKSISVYTNNPEKVRALRSITKEVIPLASVATHESGMKYLQTKRERLHHRTILETFKLPTPRGDVAKTRIAVVHAAWNEYYVDELVRAAEDEFTRVGAQLVKVAVPGACELVSGTRAVLRQHKPDAVLVLGVLIRGSSDVYEATCSAVMNGLMNLNATQDTPVVSGLLMCQNEEQAHERSHSANNPGKAWAETALHMASLNLDLRQERFLDYGGLDRRQTTV